MPKFGTLRFKRGIQLAVFYFLAIMLSGAILSFNGGIVQAANFSIANGDTNGLINALNVSNTNGQANTIDLAAGGNYTFGGASNGSFGGSALLVNQGNVTINGNGATIQRNGAGGTPAFRLFYVAPGSTLTIRNVTLNNGATPGGFAGGGIFSLDSNITLDRVTFTNNYGDTGGGGVFTAGGSFTVNNSTFTSNSSPTSGGGFFASTGTVTINNTAFNGNSASGSVGGVLGGGVFNNEALLTITNSTFTRNSAISGGGIGILKGSTSVSYTTFNSNTAGGSVNSGGGGIFNSNATLGISNSTFNGNRAAGGGSIYTASFTTLIVNTSNFTNNLATGAALDSAGGAISSAGVATVSNSTFSNNTSTLGGIGGAIYTYKDGNANAGMTINNATFTSNSVTANGSGLGGFGGAIYHFGPIKMVINSSSFSDNRAATGSGAIANEGGDLTVNGSTFFNNTTSGGSGGALGSASTTFYSGSSPSMTVINSTFVNNSAPGAGGGIVNTSGGGIPAKLAVTNSTFTGNSAGNFNGGGGIFNNKDNQPGSIATATLYNNVLSNNTGGNCTGFAPYAAGGGNIAFPAVETCTQGTTVAQANPLSAAGLADNGGPVKTVALSQSSAAIDAANPAVCPAKDSRGFGRSGNCDAGAFEANGDAPPVNGVTLLPATIRIATTLDNSRPRLQATGPNPSNPPNSSSVSIQAGGVQGIPANATGIMGILTNVNCTGGGNLRFWAGTNVPANANNLNIPGASFGLNLSTSFVTPLDGSGKVNLGLGGGNVSCGYAVDVVGYTSAGGTGQINMLPATVRVATTLDNSQPRLQATGQNPSNPPDSSAVEIQAGGSNGIPGNATGIIGVLTNVGCTGGGNLRFWTGTTVPANANNLNIPGANPALNLSTSFVAPLDGSGKVNLGLGSGALISCGYAVDVVGYITGGAGNLSLLPGTVRVANTLDFSAPRLRATGANPSNSPDTSTFAVKAGGTNGIPGNATGLLGVVTNVGCTGGGNLRFWAGTNVPANANNLNVPGANFALNLSTGFATPLDSNSGRVNLGLGSGAPISCGYAVDAVAYLN